MEEVQRFALKNIYCAPAQDRQYRFKLVRVTTSLKPATRTTTVYDRLINLPTPNRKYHVYVIGNVPPKVLNLVNKSRVWHRDNWVSVEDDINERNFIMQFYNVDGVTFPRSKFYYRVNRGTELIIALELDHDLTERFNVDTCRYLRFYSNQFFTTNEFDINNPNRVKGITCFSEIVNGNIEKLTLQNRVEELESKGGKSLVYVNGLLIDKVRLSIPDSSWVEILYDYSIESMTTLPISEMRTFNSTKDNRVKYFIHREREVNSIQYEDDLEVYITGELDGRLRGLYYYQHKDYALTNVTDKDFALDTQFVNTQRSTLVDMIGGTPVDKTVTIFCRRSSVDRYLTYSSIKLHELYKLPHTLQRDILSNVNTTLHEFRVEYLEDSDYFKVVSANGLRELSKELTTSAVGYSGVKYYYGNTPSKVPDSDPNINVPYLYREPSTVYEYDSNGLLIGHYPTVGPMYTVTNNHTKYLEFIQGRDTSTFKLNLPNEVVEVEDREYRLIAAYYNAKKRVSDWVDVTEENYVIREGNTVTITDETYSAWRVIYTGDCVTKDIEVGFVDGNITFFILVMDDRGDGPVPYPLDVPFDSVEIFLNGYRLTHGVDFEMKYPNVAITSKKYFDYTLEKQKIHIRLTGFNIVTDDINSTEVKGFVHHGTLTRNNYYDIRDDKVFSIFVDGRLVDRSKVRFSEEDNTVRVTHPLNGVPYTIQEHKVSITPVTGLRTEKYYKTDRELNRKISELFNMAFPEPSIDDFIVISDHHYLYSTLVSKVIHDLLEGNISPSVYMSPYNDSIIHDLIRNEYEFYYYVDPIRKDLPDNIVEIHPHSGNDVIDVNLFQYRFISNLVRIITAGKERGINLSGYLRVNDDTSETEVEFGPSAPGGVIVL